jgi:hypothetical protein
MPRELEESLKTTAANRGYSESRTNRYIYGTLAKLRKRRKDKAK